MWKSEVWNVTSEHRLIFNIVSTKLYHKIINKQTDRDAYKNRHIKGVGVVFYISISWQFSFFNF